MEDRTDFDKLLDEFISAQLQETEDAIIELDSEKKNSTDDSDRPQTPASSAELTNQILDDIIDPDIDELAEEEKRLYNALTGFISSAKLCEQEAEIHSPKEFAFTASLLLPRFRPSQMSIIQKDILQAWEILIKTQPLRLASLPINASDEQLLSFAEKTTDKNLQLAIISYVETLIELEACEIAYNLRKTRYQKHKIEKKLYEEQIQRQNKMRKFISAIKEKGFPVDADMLVNNFFKTVRKDPNGAQKILENNPATFAPIQVEKIRPSFFGMIKPKPSDGIKINKKLGKFLKNLKA